MSPGSPRIVTLAALYGAGGGVIGPRVAERLGVPFLDRQIPEEVARAKGISEDAVSEVDEEPRTVSKRLASTLGRASTVTGASAGPAEELDLQERQIRGYIEEFLAEAARSGGVALGRGGMVVLRAAPSALHVHLGGPREARIEQAMRIESLDRDTAAARLEIEDEARIGYVSRVYGVDGEDPNLYHLMLDSTAIELESCIDLIVAASEDRVRNPRPLPSI